MGAIYGIISIYPYLEGLVIQGGTCIDGEVVHIGYGIYSNSMRTDNPGTEDLVRYDPSHPGGRVFPWSVLCADDHIVYLNIQEDRVCRCSTAGMCSRHFKGG